jgi:hypothetical protein
MNYDEKMEDFRRVLKERGEKERRFIPPIYPLLRKIGFHPVPPVFRPYGKNALVFGCAFFLVLGLVQGLFWLFGSREENHGPLHTLVSCVIAGTAFGLLMSCFVEWRKERIYFGEWDSFGARHEREKGETGATGSPDSAR